MALVRLTILLSIITAMSVLSIEAKPTIKIDNFGNTSDGKNVKIYTLTNSKGAEAKIITFGGIVTSLKMPDKNGVMGNVVLGYDNLQGYENDSFYIGALIGRYANRIGNAQFTLNGKIYNLAKNNGENSLHGGPKGYHKVVWEVGKSFVDKNGANLELTYLSKDGEEGFPANLKIKVIYTLTETNDLKVDYFATSDSDTIVNLTQHSYFNLAGKGDILNHQLQINADKFTPTDKSAIPTGEFKIVKGTPFDFNSLTEIGKRMRRVLLQQTFVFRDLLMDAAAHGEERARRGERRAVRPHGHRGHACAGARGLARRGARVRQGVRRRARDPGDRGQPHRGAPALGDARARRAAVPARRADRVGRPHRAGRGEGVRRIRRNWGGSPGGDHAHQVLGDSRHWHGCGNERNPPSA